MRKVAPFWLSIVVAVAITWCSALFAQIAAGDIQLQYSGEMILIPWFAAVGVWFIRVLWSRHFKFTIQLVVALTLIVALSLTIPLIAMAIVSVAVVFDVAIQKDSTQKASPSVRSLQIPAGVAALGLLTYGLVYTYLI